MLHLPNSVPTLVVGELTLRPWALEDVEAVFEFCQDPAIQLYTTIPVPYTREDAQKYIQNKLNEVPSEDLSWAIIWQGAVAGSVTLHHIFAFDHIAELGYLMAPHARGRGFMAAAAKAVCDYGFSIGLRRISALTLPENQGSQRTLLAAGFELEGIQRGAMTRRDDTQTDSVIFAKFPPVVIDEGEAESK